MKAAPPGELLRLVEGFLSSYGFNKARRHLGIEQKARNKKIPWKEEINRKLSPGMPTLVEIFQSWQTQHRNDFGATSLPHKSSEHKSDKVTSESSGEESEPNSKIIKVKTETQKAGKANLKRKKSSDESPTESSSSSEAEGSSDSSSDESPSPIKKQKISESKSKAINKSLPSPVGHSAQKDDSSPSTSSSESSGSSSEDESESESTSGNDTKMKLDIIQGTKEANDDREDSKTSTNSSKTLNGDGPAQASKKHRISSDSQTSETSSAGSGSSSGSSSDSDSDSDSGSDHLRSNSGIKERSKKTVSKSSNKQSKKASSSEMKPVHAVGIENGKEQKKENAPFSRIPKDTKIDPRFSSNKYIPYDYAQKAHEDLVVTKGRGFTKEKNKKKRGSYRGGFIDTTGGKGVKFED